MIDFFIKALSDLQASKVPDEMARPIARPEPPRCFLRRDRLISGDCSLLRNRSVKKLTLPDRLLRNLTPVVYTLSNVAYCARVLARFGSAETANPVSVALRALAS